MERRSNALVAFWADIEPSYVERYRQWHTEEHIPERVAIGLRARATQIIGLGRRYRIAIQRDPELAAALAEADGPIPDRYWARLAEMVAAVR